MSRTWTDGWSRLEIEHRDGRAHIAIHGVNLDGQVIDHGYAASFSKATREEIAQYITEAT